MRDYADRPFSSHNPRGGARYHTQHTRHGLKRLSSKHILLLGALALGLLFTWIKWPSKPPATESVSVEAEEVEAAPKSKRKSKPKAETQSDEVRFDFYTLLPDISVDVANPNPTATASIEKPSTISARDTPEQPVTTPAPTSTSSPVTPGTTAFMIQAGSFRQVTDADNLKASLTLQGFDSQVQSATLSNGQTRYRVYVGPFASEEDAIRTQVLLKDYILDSLVVKM